MGATRVPATVYGRPGRKSCDYSFMVDTGSTYLALPPEEIAALGLQPSGGTVKLISATGLVDVPTYLARGQLRGEFFGAVVVPAAIPLLGVELLQNLRYRVNPVNHTIEKVPDDEIHPPYQL